MLTKKCQSCWLAGSLVLSVCVSLSLCVCVCVYPRWVSVCVRVCLNAFFRIFPNEKSRSRRVEHVERTRRSLFLSLSPSFSLFLPCSVCVYMWNCHKNEINIFLTKKKRVKQQQQSQEKQEQQQRVSGNKTEAASHKQRLEAHKRAQDLRLVWGRAIKIVENNLLM